MSKRLTTKQFIANARKVHGTKYDYSHVEYVNTHTPVTIICPQHGPFNQKPVKHVSQKCGCPHNECALTQTLTKKQQIFQQQFLNTAPLIHNNKYDYSLVQYIHARKKVTIICPVHGEFNQTPNSHLNGNGCPKCKKIGVFNHTTVAKPSNAIQPATVYVLSFTDADQTLYKIGITTRPLKQRLYEYPVDYTIVLTLECNLRQAFNIEQHVLNTTNRQLPQTKFIGYTECFSINEHIDTFTEKIVDFYFDILYD